MGEQFSLATDISLGEFMDNGFGENVKKIIASFPNAKEPEFKSLVEKELDAFIKSVITEVKNSLKPATDRRDRLHQDLNELSLYVNRLQTMWFNCDKSLKTTYYYWALYLALLIAGISIFTWSYRLIMPEQHTIIGFLQSITLCATPFMIARAYERSNKARFLKYLHWIGIGAGIVMGFSAGIARGIAYKILGSSQHLTLTGGTPSSWIDSAQLIVSGILFMSIVGVELTFGGRLLICINELTSTKKSAEELEKDLEKAKEDLQVLEKTTHSAYVKVGQIENFDLFSESWKASWVESLVLQYRSFWEKTKERARNNVDNLPPGSIISLAK